MYDVCVCLCVRVCVCVCVCVCMCVCVCVFIDLVCMWSVSLALEYTGCICVLSCGVSFLPPTHPPFLETRDGQTRNQSGKAAQRVPTPSLLIMCVCGSV